MQIGRTLDQLAAAMQRGESITAANGLMGALATLHALQPDFAAVRNSLRAHPIHAMLLEDPHSNRAFTKPRGYAGDAELIDYYYDRVPPAGTTALGKTLFDITTGFATSQAVDFRRGYAAERLERAWIAGKRVCALACGHWREADGLAGKDVSNLVGVDQDPLSLGRVRAKHNRSIHLVEANVLHYLRNAARDGERFDFIYTLGLTDYFDDRAMRLLYRLMQQCLAPKGEFLVANFMPGHISSGWMDAVMDWQLVYRDAPEMLALASEIGMAATVCTDPTDSIIICEMRPR